jgi:hypothetical protein
MNQIGVRSFAAACMIVAAGYEPRRIEILDDEMPVFYFDDAAGVVAQRFQQVKSLLRHAETQAVNAKLGQAKAAAR